MSVPVQSQSDNEIQSAMKDFWENRDATLEAMTFSDDFSLINGDRDEVLDFLPDYSNKRVLELAAGVGRFTGILARKATHVTAIDFIQSFTDENKKNNSGLDNVTFLCADASKVDFPPASFDLVFSGWLFTNLSDEEVEENLIRTLRWLTPGGHIFFRECCKLGLEYPGFYRLPFRYVALLQSARLQVPPLNISGFKEAHFTNLKTRSSLAYMKAKQSPFECFFMAEKTQNPRPDTCQQFHLDHRFSDRSIAKLESIFGSSWTLPGEEFIVKKYYPRLGVSADDRVLNLSCGTGGSSFLMADFNDVKVHGVDRSPYAIARAVFSQGKSPDKFIGGKIVFEGNDVLEMKLHDDCYDDVFSYGFLQTLTTTNNLFSKLYRCVTPGGRLLMVEYCRGTVAPPTNCNQSGWAKMTLEEHKRALKDAGWKGVQAEDIRNELLETLRQSLDKFTAERENFVSKFSQEEFSHLLKWITDKVTELESQKITLGLFIAHK